MEWVEITTAPRPSGCVIWLHGLGADGHDFEALVPELKLPPSLALRFIFPHAPMRAVTVNGGAKMRAWYDIDPRAPLSGGEDIRVSAALISNLIKTEMHRGLPAERILLAGFSQGGVIALHLALRYEEPLAGVMGLSTYLHDREHLTDEISLANSDIPLFLAHGISDPMIPISRGAAARDTLRNLNYAVEWHEYPMAHQVCMREIQDISQWLQQRFDNTPKTVDVPA